MLTSVALLVLDCIPDWETSAGRDVWLTLACVAIFFNAINSSTYRKKDGKSLRTIAHVRKGPEITPMEAKTVEYAQCGAAEVVIRIAELGYDTRDGKGENDEEDIEGGEETDEEEGGVEEDDEDGILKELFRLPWIPHRFRPSIRFILHFACAVMAERHLFSVRQSDHHIPIKNLEARFLLDIANFLGSRVRDVLEQMFQQLPRLLRTPSLAHATDSMVYVTKTFKRKSPSKFVVPKISPEFERRIQALEDWEVSVIIW